MYRKRNIIQTDKYVIVTKLYTDLLKKRVCRISRFDWFLSSAVHIVQTESTLCLPPCNGETKISWQIGRLWKPFKEVKKVSEIQLFGFMVALPL